MEALMPYQETGVQFLRGRTRAMLLDQQGLGKTPQAIRAAEAVGADTVSVVCPAIGRVMWQRAFPRWAAREIKVQVLSYGEAVRRVPRDYTADVLILDEAQYLKNPLAQRTRKIYGDQCRGGPDSLIGHAACVWLLSGTLAPNGGHESYTHLRALWPERITFKGETLTQWGFIHRYYHTRTNPYTLRVTVTEPRAARKAELKQIVHPLMLRRMKADVLKQLPPLRTETVVLPAKSRQYSAKEEALIQRAINAQGSGSGDPDGPQLAEIRRLTGEAKITPALEYCRELLDSGEPKIVIFCYHRRVIAALAEGLKKYGAGVIQGGQSDAQRQQVIDRFQSDPDARVIVGQITACNAVIDLSAAAREVFVEWSFSPGENAQAAERCHRFTTKNAVLVSFLSLEGSLDEAITRVVERKTAALAALWSTSNVERTDYRDDHRGEHQRLAELVEGIAWGF